jgi:hypothetical protein
MFVYHHRRSVYNWGSIRLQDRTRAPNLLWSCIYSTIYKSQSSGSVVMMLNCQRRVTLQFVSHQIASSRCGGGKVLANAAPANRLQLPDLIRLSSFPSELFQYPTGTSLLLSASCFLITFLVNNILQCSC